MPTLSELRQTREQLENGMEQLRDRLAEAEGQLAAGHRRGRGGEDELRQRERVVHDLRREIHRCKIAILDLGEVIANAESSEVRAKLAELESKNEATRSELDLVRRELARSLLGLSGLLHRHQELCDQKIRLTQELAKVGSTDLAYENYISCALLLQQDYAGDLKFVVDTLKKIRPVA